MTHRMELQPAAINPLYLPPPQQAPYFGGPDIAPKKRNLLGFRDPSNLIIIFVFCCDVPDVGSCSGGVFLVGYRPLYPSLKKSPEKIVTWGNIAKNKQTDGSLYKEPGSFFYGGPDRTQFFIGPRSKNGLLLIVVVRAASQGYIFWSSGTIIFVFGVLLIG